MLSAVLRCEACGWQTICGEVEIARRLRVLGLLRRAPHPPEELVRELLTVHVDRLACDQCDHLGIVWTEGDSGEGSNEDWQQAERVVSLFLRSGWRFSPMPVGASSVRASRIEAKRPTSPISVPAADRCWSCA